MKRWVLLWRIYRDCRAQGLSRQSALWVASLLEHMGHHAPRDRGYRA